MAASYYRVRWNEFFDGGNSAVGTFHTNWLNDKNLPEIKETDVYSKIAELIKITDSITVEPLPIINNQIETVNKGAFSTRFGPGFVTIITNPECKYEMNLYSLKGATLRKIQGKGSKIYRTDRLGIADGLFIVQIQSITMSRTFKVYIK